MTRVQVICAIAAPFSVAVGIMFGVLPRNWIELGLGFDPDGASGFLELLLTIVPVAIGLGLAMHVFRPDRSMNSDGGADSASLLQ